MIVKHEFEEYTRGEEFHTAKHHSDTTEQKVNLDSIYTKRDTFVDKAVASTLMPS